MWRRVRRWWSEIDWNWRNFSRLEWFWLAFAVFLLVFWLASAPIMLPFQGWWWLLNAYWVPGSILMFGETNRHRQGLLEPEMWTNRTRPISVGTLRLILGGGFLAIALLLVTLVSLGSR